MVQVAGLWIRIVAVLWPLPLLLLWLRLRMWAAMEAGWAMVMVVTESATPACIASLLVVGLRAYTVYVVCTVYVRHQLLAPAWVASMGRSRRPRPGSACSAGASGQKGSGWGRLAGDAAAVATVRVVAAVAVPVVMMHPTAPLARSRSGV